MNVSSIPASPPAKPPEPIEPKPPQVKADPDTETGASRTPQPTVVAPLPPGQGTRINQFA